VSDAVDYGRFQTRSAALKEVLRQAEKAAFVQASVSIFGEQGSGRRTLARWIFDRGLRPGASFVTWAPEVSEELPLLSEGDTLLIENIDECTSGGLLRVRQAMDRFPMNRVRWIVTSRGEASSWMESSSVARELAYRLCVVNLRMPRLQDRREDIADLARLFLSVCSLVNGLPEKSFSAGAIEALLQYSWVGHVAELNNVIEKAALTSEQSQIEAANLFFLGESQEQAEQIHQLVQGGMSLFEMERKLIYQTLELTRQNKTRAAQILGISIRTLRNKLNTYREGGLNVGTL